jgi:hypothetical protein
MNDMKAINSERDFSKGCLWVMIYLIILVLLLFIVINKCESRGAIYLLHHPVDYGIGVRVDYYPLKNPDSVVQLPGFYNSVSYGSGGLYKLYGLRDHIKISSGVLIPLRPYPPARYAVSAGVNYHSVNRGSPGDIQVNEIILRPWSFEAGLSVYMRRLAVCFSTDILRWEPCIGIGYVF